MSLLSRSSRVVGVLPLNIPLLVINRTVPDLIDSHRHARTNFRKLQLIVPCTHVEVVPHLDTIIFQTLERNGTIANFHCSVPGGEQVCQNALNTFTQLCGETIKDKVRIRLRDSAFQIPGKVVPGSHVVQTECDRRSVW